MPEVNFTALSPGRYEEMVAVLLSRLHSARRVDGSGGDGGRDAYFAGADGAVHAFEMKSFTGRMTPSRRQQVKRSLDRALERSPATWTLIVPIDFTDSEQGWFDGLRGDCPATVLDWRGKTWLQDQLAAFPDIGRYFGGAAEEVIALLASIAHENALPRDVLEVASRMRSQANRLNEIDPYYFFHVAVDGERTVVTARPKYPGAERDRPITVNATLRFDASPEARAVLLDLEDHIAFGSRVVLPSGTVGDVVIDAPGGIGGTFTGGTIILDGTLPPTPGAATELVLRTPIAGAGTTLRLRVTRRYAGQRGLRISAVDAAGLLDVDFRADVTQSRFDANFRTHSTTTEPADVALVTLRFLIALAAAGELAILTQDGVHIATARAEFGRWAPDPEYVEAVALLAEAQRLSGVYFPPPPGFSGEDVDDIDHSVRLLRGDSLPATWSTDAGTVSRDAAREILDQFAELGETVTLFKRVPQWLEIGGHRLHIGVVEEVRHSARLVNRDEVQAWLERSPDEDAQVRVEFAAGNNSDVTLRLCDEVPPSDDS